MCGTSSATVASGVLGSFSGMMNSMQENEQNSLRTKNIEQKAVREKKEIKENAIMKKGSNKAISAASGIDVHSKTTKDIENDIDRRASKEISYIDEELNGYKKQEGLKKKHRKQNLLFSTMKNFL